MGWAAAAVSVGASLLGGGGKDKSWKAEVDKMGTNKAAVTAQAARNFQSLPRKARAIESQAVLANVEIEKNRAAAEANAIVGAAASGSAGLSVEATIQDTERTAMEARTQVRREQKAGQAQLEQEYEDIFWAADASKYQYHHVQNKGASTGQQLLTAALAGAGTYFASRK